MAIIPGEITVKITFDASPLQDIENMLTALRDALKDESPDDLVTCSRCYGGSITCLSCHGTGVVPRYVAENIIKDRGERG
jgi:hypothetical protein